jgi:hypothetical protein
MSLDVADVTRCGRCHSTWQITRVTSSTLLNVNLDPIVLRLPLLVARTLDVQQNPQENQKTRGRVKMDAHYVIGWRLKSVSGLAWKIWYRVPFDQSEQSKAIVSPTMYLADRPGRVP